MDSKWAPDSKSIFFVSDYDSDIRTPSNSDVRVITRMQYRFDGEGYFDGRRRHLFRATLEHSGNIMRLTSGEFDIQSFSPSPDGNRIAFVSNLHEQADFEVNQYIYLLSLDPKENRIERIIDWKGPIETLAFSPDGRCIAFIGHDYRNEYNTAHGVHVVGADTATVENLTDSLSGSAINCINTDVVLRGSEQPPVWLHDSKTILFLATIRGRCHIFSVDPITKNIEDITRGDFTVGSI